MGHIVAGGIKLNNFENEEETRSHLFLTPKSFQKDFFIYSICVQVSPFPNTSVKSFQNFFLNLVDLCSGTSSTLSAILTIHPPPYPTTPACSSLRSLLNGPSLSSPLLCQLQCRTQLLAVWSL